MTTSIDTDSFGFLITDLSRLLRAEMDRRIARAGLGLTPGEVRTLAHAARAGSVRQTVLAERMGVEAMTISGFLDRLEAHGLIERATDPADRRAKLVRITDAADAALEHIGDVSAGIREQALQTLSKEEWKTLKELLKRARANLSEARSDCSRPRKGKAA